MSQMRRDVFSGQWVIFASNRKDKPYNYKHNRKVEEKDKTICPFCPGNESFTPPSKFELKGEKGWEIRVFENMYPAVSLENYERDNDSFYETMAGIGIHEILVDTPVHTMDTSNDPDEHYVKLFGVIADRIKAMRQNENVEYIQVFKNNGPFAGASITHSHWQIMSVPHMPDEQKAALAAYKDYLAKNGRCIMCDMLEHEKNEKIRIISENESFICFAPYASRQSFELWIVPKRHISTMPQLNGEELKALAAVLKDMIKRVMKLRENISFNICIQEEPKSVPEGLFHWYMRILPRIGSWAGFEFSTGCLINPVVPEFAADFYRKQKSE